MTEAEFIGEINDELTGSGSLPVVVNEREIKRLIRQESKYFYKNFYEESVQTYHYVIQAAEFQNATFQSTRTIPLPACVVSVTKVREINGIGRLGNIDRDFAEDRLIASEIFLSSFHGDDLVMRTAQYAYFDLSKAFFLEGIGYDFNHNTKELIITGRDPKFDVFIQAWIQIPIDKLYDDYYFLRWITCRAKQSFARIVGTYKFPLIGNAEIDYESLKAEATEELTELKEEIIGNQPPNWFLVYHLHPISILAVLMLLYYIFILNII